MIKDNEKRNVSIMKDADGNKIALIHEIIFSGKRNINWEEVECAYSARTAHPFQRNGAPFRFKLSKAQQVD